VRGGDPEETLSVYGLISLAISLPHKREGSGECADSFATLEIVYILHIVYY